MELGPELTGALTDPDRVYDTAATMEPLSLARTAHACTHTTFSPNVVRGGVKINVIPDRIEVDVDVRALPGVTPDEVDAMLVEALGDLAPRVEIERLRSQMGSTSAFDTPLGDALRRVATALVPGSRVVPMITTGGTDAKYFRRIPHTEYPLMFHGHNERVDVLSLRLSAQMWETLCREFLG
jgi:acetylornithine deacetylase/succinyl-diaminopimelate desuccinylase-like protein